MGAAAALRRNDLLTFGTLMYQSHSSLRDNYEVSGKELDTIVDFCSAYDGCIGARMTGAGFGGCAIALVKAEQASDFISKVTASYNNSIGYKPEIFSTIASGGVRST